MIKLTIDELAKGLELPVSTVERWVRQGRIPIRKSGSAYLIDKAGLKKWAVSHNLSFSLEKKKNEEEYILKVSLLSSVERGGVFYNLQGDNMEAVLRSAVNCVPAIIDKKELYKQLIERERLNSTGIGNGVAIPHPRIPLSNGVKEPLITTCFLEKPVNFNAIDDQPVFVMFILLNPTVKMHLSMLSRLAFCLRNNSFIQFLKKKPPSEALFEKMADFDIQLESSD